MYIKNVAVDNFSTPNNFKAQIDFVYDNKNYNCKCSQFDNFVFNDGRNTVMNKK